MEHLKNTPQDLKAAPNQPPSSPPCKFCKRPSHCPTCTTALSPPPTTGATNIDGLVPDIHKQLPPPVHDMATAKHPAFHIAFPPDEPSYGKFSVFAAGSIEMGSAIQWQGLLANYLCPLPLTLCNPRRGHWDKNTIPSAETDVFRAQVEWELQALTASTVICFFFDHATMSPVTMCELGLWAHSGKVVVCCDRRFWKSGNVELVCERYGVPFCQSFLELVPLVKAMLRTKGMVVDARGDLTGDERETGESWMSLGQAEALLKDNTPKRKGMAPDLKAMGNTK
jgi:hypothetical protein